ncbi:integral membrane protein [Fusarium heterosporum]|uniref:Integral membrane protein n=1 Tax=Fusarium heterosporum TaxID=42747 RepID=A0A8H5TF20_FUSHE|nr:integral membrane protein [Fusarium heterosporum]
MPPGRYTNTRQKSCHPCSTAKAKCDHKETCARCASRGLACTYPTIRATEVEDMEVDETVAMVEEAVAMVEETPVMVETSVRIQESPVTEISEPAEPERHDLDLVCPINSDDIKNRWLNSYVPLPGQTVKEYHPNVMNFVYRMLKSYASMVIRGRTPPFIHPTQLSSLSTCFTLVRICKDLLPGSESVVTSILQREMTNLYEQRETYNSFDLLGAFQAYLIYSMVLFFHLSPAMPFLRQAIINLQDIACLAARQGLVCRAEQQGIRPKWEAWVVAEAKRRTLYTMYFLDNVLSAQDGLPTYLAHELKGLYAPSSKILWQADQIEWERAYNLHLVEWPEGTFQLEQLWPGGAQADTDRWLEGVDEFGTMLYAVTSCTHGHSS